MSSDEGRHTGLALERTYQFLLWLVPVLDGFSQPPEVPAGPPDREHRNRGGVLAAVNIRLSKLQILFRLATDLRLVDRQHYKVAMATT